MDGKSVLKKYKKHNYKKWLFIVVAIVATFIMIQVALLVGSVEVSIENIINFWSTDADNIVQQVVMKIRFPRIVAAILSGSVLAVSGAVSQSLLRNPLASPFTLGISSSAAFGAAFAIVLLGAGETYSSTSDAVMIKNHYLVALSAFVWSLVSIAVIIVLSVLKKSTPEIIILSGVILSSIFNAGIHALQYFASDVQLASIVFWTFGDMSRASWSDISLIAIALVLALMYFMKQSWNYKSLQMGDDYAKSLGVNPKKVRITGMILTSLITAITVAFYGVIAFIGLLVPHIVKRVIGNDETFVIPASAILGSLLLLTSDTLARTIISPIVLPVGILTSFLGGPLFLFLLIKGLGKK